MTHYTIDEDQLVQLERVMKRLYTEYAQRSGAPHRRPGDLLPITSSASDVAIDWMRDAAHTINAVVTTMREVGVPEPAVPGLWPAGTRWAHHLRSLNALQRLVGGQPFEAGDRNCLLQAGYLRRVSAREEWQLTVLGEKVAREQGFHFAGNVVQEE